MHSPEPEAVNARAWTTYGNHHLQRGTEVPEVERISWGFWPTGPGVEVLGDLTGLRILDLCSGLGKHAAHLVREHGATVDAVEASASQHARALARYGDLPGLSLIHADAVAHLQSAEPYDVIYSVHGFGYIDPHRLLPAIRQALKPRGLLAFSVLHTNSHGRGPSSSVAPRAEILPLAGGEDQTVEMWVLTPKLWEDLCVDNGLLIDDIAELDAPEDDNPVSVRLYRARSRASVSSRPEIVCICGSTRFVDEMRAANRDLTFAGVIVVAPGEADELITNEQKTALNALHLRKIDLADRVLVVNPGGYIGESTSREIAYAHATGKPISFTDPV